MYTMHSVVMNFNPKPLLIIMFLLTSVLVSPVEKMLPTSSMSSLITWKSCPPVDKVVSDIGSNCTGFKKLVNNMET